MLLGHSRPNNLIAFEIDVYDVDVKEIFSYEDVDIQGIGNKVYDSSLAGPGNTYPIADNIFNIGTGSGWMGSFNLETHFENPDGAFPDGTFTADYTWKVVGTSRMGKGTFQLSASDLDETLTIKLPDAVGQYQVDPHSGHSSLKRSGISFGW